MDAIMSTIKFLQSKGYPYKIKGNDGYTAVLYGLQPLHDGEIAAIYKYPGGYVCHTLDEINQHFEVIHFTYPED